MTKFCEKCNRERKEDTFHCETCEICLLIEYEEHTCRETNNKDECPICLESIFEGNCAVLPCGHRPHENCFKGLMTAGANKCPLCRKTIVDEPCEDEEWVEDHLENIGVTLIGDTQEHRLRSLALWVHDRTGANLLTSDTRELLEEAEFKADILRENTPGPCTEEPHSTLTFSHSDLVDTLSRRGRRMSRMLGRQMAGALDMTDRLSRCLDNYAEDLVYLSKVTSEINLRRYGVRSGTGTHNAVTRLLLAVEIFQGIATECRENTLDMVVRAADCLAVRGPRRNSSDEEAVDVLRRYMEKQRQERQNRRRQYRGRRRR
ncbi:RING finger and CHY zinc finger domain-containing 1-like [Paramuricea clavata]|uniref:RING finger and CHY zinc finger domain-containing 1-like n=1 Tax=Paramuricea clavata TaxID=317549 RepID=A0A6S7JIX2_PARCT|nr:RING finger and CHY zinc finger domain-containing 1-like [Paramuricea clavata]